MSKLIIVALVLTYVGVQRGSATCDRNTGPAGETDCFLGTPYYTEYQCGTCLTNAYIVQSSSGKFHCRDTTAKYCYYQCMVESHGQDKGAVTADCACTVGVPIPQPPVVIAADCYSPNGTDCSWYSRCLSTRYLCTGDTEYAVSYGAKFCNLYDQNYVDFSTDGKAWIGAVRKCLQVALVPLLRLCRTPPTCDEIMTTAFDSHIPCYLNPYQGFSVCLLTPVDWQKIFVTIWTSFVNQFTASMSALIKAAMGCMGIWKNELGNLLYQLNLQALQSPTSGAGKRAVSSPSSREDIVYAAMKSISASLGWDTGSTLNWYVFIVYANTTSGTNSTTTPVPTDDWNFQLMVFDLADIGLINSTMAAGLRRLNESIAQLVNAVEHGLVVNAGDTGYQFGVTSLKQCYDDGVTNACEHTSPIVTSPPYEKNTSSGDVTRAGQLLLFLAVVLTIIYK